MGHQLSVPHVGDFHALPQEGEGRALLRTPQGVTARLIAGHSHGLDGAMQREATQPLYLDLIFPDGGGTFSQPLPAGHNAFAFVYRGSVQVEGTAVDRNRMAILANEGDGVTITATGPARALLIAGRPLREPIAQYGPFVMNTRDELIQAVEDFQSGRLAV